MNGLWPASQGFEVVLEAGGAEVQGAGGGRDIEAGCVDRSGLRREEAALARLPAVGSRKL
jgi:hypothetical protein